MLLVKFYAPMTQLDFTKNSPIVCVKKKTVLLFCNLNFE